MEKVDYKHGEFTLASTDITRYSYEDFCEWYTDCMNDGVVIPAEDSEEYRTWVEQENGGEEDYEWFVDCFCHEHDVNPIPSENSQEYWDWAGDMRDDDWECDMWNIKNHKPYDTPVVITGGFQSVRYADFYGSGLHSFNPVYADSVKDAIDLIFREHQYFDDAEIFWSDGEIRVEGHHHDGSNYFHINALSKKGLAKFRAAERRYEGVTELQKWDTKRFEYLYV